MKCCDLTSGMMRTAVTFQRESETSDGAGGVTKVWSTLLSTRAYVKPVSGAERYRAGRLEATTQVRIWIRYTSDLTTSDRVMLNGEALQIRALINTEQRNRYYEIFAESGVVT